MSNQKTSQDIHSATFLQGSAFGHTLSEKRVGQMTLQFGQDHAPVNHSPQQVNEREPMTHDISGQNSTDSSPSAILQQSLESKLHKKLEQLGSTLYKLTWKAKTTPAGWSYSQLVGSARPISVKDFIGSQAHWATPRTTDGSGGRRPITIKDGKAMRVSKSTGQTFGINLADQSVLTTWPTPLQRDHKGSSGRANQGIAADVPSMAKLSNWATPVSQDGAQSAGTTTYTQTWMKGDTRHTNLDLGRLSTWPTPVANPANGSPEKFLARKMKAVENGSTMGISLTDINMVAKMATWPTPTQRDYKDTGDLSNSMIRKDGKSRLDTVPRVATLITGPARLTASGQLVIGSTVEMKNGGSLNPDHSRWLIGLPGVWESCADMATQSLAHKRKRSSKASSRQK